MLCDLSGSGRGGCNGGRGGADEGHGCSSGGRRGAALVDNTVADAKALEGDLAEDAGRLVMAMVNRLFIRTMYG